MQLPDTPAAAGPAAAGIPVEPIQTRRLSADALSLRPARPDDAAACGRICFDAFHAIATHHSFPPDFPTVQAGVELFGFILSQPDVHVVVAELDGRIVGSNVLWEQTPIAGVGPITVEPAFQNSAAGRALMRYVLERTESKGHRGVRLVQAAYHNRSLALYTKLGFEPKEPLSVFQGPAVGRPFPDRPVRPATTQDIEGCGHLGETLHGFSRAGELPAAIAQGTALVVEHRGRITGYATQVGFLGHSMGRSDSDIMALIGAAQAYPGPGFLVPTRNAVLMRWCLDSGFRLVMPMTLMSQGFYRQPKGAWLPSVLF